jgi:hypothetical protein
MITANGHIMKSAMNGYSLGIGDKPGILFLISTSIVLFDVAEVMNDW